MNERNPQCMAIELRLLSFDKYLLLPGGAIKILMNGSSWKPPEGT